MNFLASNIRFLRKLEGKSQSQIGQLINKASNTITQWENGTRQPKIQDLVNIANYFGKSLDDMVNKDLCREYSYIIIQSKKEEDARQWK